MRFSSLTNNDHSANQTKDEVRAHEPPDDAGDETEADKGFHRRAAQRKLDVESLGKPGQILVLPLTKRRRAKVKQQYEQTSDIDSAKHNNTTSSLKLFSDSNEQAKDGTEYISYLEELRSPYSRGDTVSRTEYLELQAKIEMGFTLSQLSNYYTSHRNPPPASSSGSDIETLSNDGSTAAHESEQWQANESSDNKAEENELLTTLKTQDARKTRSKTGLRKDKLAQRILRDCWHLGIHDEIGSLDIRLPPEVISMILVSEQYSLEELAHSHGTKIEPFGSLHLIRVSGNRSACESVRDIVKTYASEIHIESFEQPLLHDNSWLIDGEEAKNEFLESLMRTYGIHINSTKRSSVASAAFSKKNENFVQLKRDLEIASLTQSTNERVPFCSDVPPTAAGFLQGISTKRRQVMSLLERGKPWSRWTIPTSVEDYKEHSLPPLFSQHQASFSSEIFQILREKSNETGQNGHEEKLSATIGQCLFRTPHDLDSTMRISPTQLGESAFPRYFHNWLHAKAESLVKTRRIFPGDRTQVRLHRFRLNPCLSNSQKLPVLEVEVSVPWVNAPEAKFPFAEPELLSLKAIVQETSIDYLLPEINYDIRFTRTASREVYRATASEKPEALRDALLSSMIDMLKDPKRPFPPSCQLPIPVKFSFETNQSNSVQTVTGDCEGDIDVVQGTYWFPGMHEALGTMMRTYEYAGERLCYSPSARNYLDSRSDHLYLEMFVNSTPSYYTRLQGRTNVNQSLDPASDTIEQEFRAFYMTACELAIELTKHNSRRSQDSSGDRRFRGRP